MSEHLLQKYLYLGQENWVSTWVQGGRVPLRLASSYLSDERRGTLTPDENLIHRSSVPIPSFEKFGLKISNVKNINISNNTYNGVPMPEETEASYYQDDGLVLCLSNSFDREVGLRLGKAACVRLVNVKKTKKRIDKQLGRRGEMKSCEYTDTHERDHFLKSVEDSWQDEFRIFWPITEEREIMIPAGTAELVQIFGECS